jgi:hypothetical protein
MESTPRCVVLSCGLLAFCLLVLLNVGGYRYGVSDQAFYIPIVRQGLEPGLFPHDAPLLAVQNRLLAFDDWFAPLVRFSGQSLPATFFGTYLAGLALLYGAVVLLGRSLYRTWWGIATLTAAMTLRHRIPDTAVNSLEAYMHPRQLAFCIGLLAMGLFLRGRMKGAACAVAAACLFHPTTALWFVILLGTAAVVSHPPARRPLLLACCTALPVTTVLLVGALREHLDIMSPAWATLLESKDYLLAAQWPMLTWFANLGLAAIIVAAYDYRRSMGMTVPREDGLVAGCMTLLALFLVSVPLASLGVTLVVQLQFSRVFWLLDAVAIAYAAWFVVESPLALRTGMAGGDKPRRSPARRSTRLRFRRAALALVVLASLARGSYVTFVERADHALIEVDLPESEWTQVMQWAGQRPVGTNFLADPGHAWRYGSSIRAASGRDVYLESVKDTGIAIYSRAMAERISSRLAELGDFAALEAAHARWLAKRHDLDYLITEHDIALPLVHRRGAIAVYDLRDDTRMARRGAQDDGN